MLIQPLRLNILIIVYILHVYSRWGIFGKYVRNSWDDLWNLSYILRREAYFVKITVIETNVINMVKAIVVDEAIAITWSADKMSL